MANIVTEALRRHAHKPKQTLSRTGAKSERERGREREASTRGKGEKQRKDEPLAVQIQNFIITKHVTGAISVQISVYLLATNNKTHEGGRGAEPVPVQCLAHDI